jgi:hypothetical protein
VPATNPVLTRAAESIFTAWRDDGRFRLSPSRGMLPCHTAHAAAALSQLGMPRTLDSSAPSPTSWRARGKAADGGATSSASAGGRRPSSPTRTPRS